MEKSFINLRPVFFACFVQIRILRNARSSLKHCASTAAEIILRKRKQGLRKAKIVYNLIVYNFGLSECNLVDKFMDEKLSWTKARKKQFWMQYSHAITE